MNTCMCTWWSMILMVISIVLSSRGHSWLGYYFWDKGLKDYVVVDIGIYHELLLFDQ